MLNNDPKSQNTDTTTTRHRNREEGDTMTAGNWRKSSVPVSISAPPRFPAACQRSDPSERAQPCLLAPSNHQEVLQQYLVRGLLRRRALLQLISRPRPRAGVRDDSARSYLMSAQRGNLHLAGHLRTGGRTPHYFFLKSGKSAKKTPSNASSAKRGNEADHRAECKKVQCHHFLNERFRQEPDIVL